MTGFDYEIDRDIGYIKVIYKSDNKDIFKNKPTKECFEYLANFLLEAHKFAEIIKKMRGLKNDKDYRMV